MPGEKDKLISRTIPVIEGIQVGFLTLWFDTSGRAYPFHFPPSQAQFNLIKTAEVSKASAVSDEVVLKLQEMTLSRKDQWTSLICRNEIWELWLDEQGQFVFYNPMQSLLRQIVIDPGFHAGELRGDFSARGSPSNYFLPQDLEIVFFVNWLAKFGDVILHASGFAMDGKGYVFIGPSGIGKSTLAATLSRQAELTILGEDQVVLRQIDGRFWVYGSPFHENPAMCSPLGVPLEKLFFLERKDNDSILSVNRTEGVTRLLQTAFIPYYRPDSVDKILARLVILSEQIPFYALSYQLGSDVLGLILRR